MKYKSIGDVLAGHEQIKLCNRYDKLIDELPERFYDLVGYQLAKDESVNINVLSPQSDVHSLLPTENISQRDRVILASAIQECLDDLIDCEPHLAYVDDGGIKMKTIKLVENPNV